MDAAILFQPLASHHFRAFQFTADKMVEEKSNEIFRSLDEAYDSELSEGDEEEQKTAKKHKQLLNDISAITGTLPKRVALRSEPSAQVDEHLWSQKGDKKDKVNLNDLLQSVAQSSSLGSLKKKIQKLERSQNVLDTPLTKQQKEKIERTITYQENSREISKWAPTVIKNREAENLSFPLAAYVPPEVTTKSVAVTLKPRTKLEREIAAVLKGSSSILERRGKELTEAEEKALQAVDLQEAIARRKELQKLRALQSYYELKCKRLKKIKSKKFRKIHRKSEQRKEEKKDKEITEDDKEVAATEQEKKRVLERAHLRHRNTSKWAKKMITKENKSNEEKQLIHDQLQVSRKLTEQKVYEDESEEEGEKPDNEDGLMLLKSTDNSDNPWLLGHKSKLSKNTNQGKSLSRSEDMDDKSDSEDDHTTSEEEKDSDDEWNKAGINHKENDSKKKKRKRKNSVNNELESDEEYEGVIDMATEDGVEDGGRVTEKIEENQDADMNDFASELSISKAKNSSITDSQGSSKKTKSNEMDPESFLSFESKALDVDVLLTDNSELDFSKSREQQMRVREAFANDEVVEEFQNEKKKRNRDRMPKDVDLTLPGWGDWGGAAIDNEKVLKKKRRTFVKRGKKLPPSKDEKLRHVIINEDNNKRFSANQVSSLPFPFSSNDQFERSIRQPLGKTWNTPSVSAKLTQPKVSTLIGTIIEPIKKTKDIDKVDVDALRQNKSFISNKKKTHKK